MHPPVTVLGGTHSVPLCATDGRGAFSYAAVEGAACSEAWKLDVGMGEPRSRT